MAECVLMQCFCYIHMWWATKLEFSVPQQSIHCILLYLTAFARSHSLIQTALSQRELRQVGRDNLSVLRSGYGNNFIEADVKFYNKYLQGALFTRSKLLFLLIIIKHVLQT